MDLERSEVRALLYCILYSGFGYVNFHQLFDDLEMIIGIGLRMISQIDLFANSNWIFFSLK